MPQQTDNKLPSDKEIKDDVELDDQTDVQEQSESIPASGLYPYDPTHQAIEVEELPFSIYEYLRQLGKGKIIVRPSFQRNMVWGNVQKSQFIESVLLNFPLPPIYLNQTKDNKYIVIDGLQRTTALEEFFDDEFALTGLEALQQYNGQRFSDLGDLQSKLEDKKLTIFSLKPSTPLPVIYELFKRINTGGTQLNRQEVRNCIFNGKSTALLSELAESDEFRKAIDYGVSPKRMKDQEVALRYIAFRWGNPDENYDGDLSRYIEDMMRRLNAMSDEELTTIKKDFSRTMAWAYRLWGRNSFRIPKEDSRGIVNTAVFESVGCFISSCSDEFLKRHQPEISDRYFSRLLCTDEYIKAVTSSTGSKLNVKTRMNLAKSILTPQHPILP